MIHTSNLSFLCQDNDTDGICSDVDNCPDNANPYQADIDNDGAGHVCDPDGSTAKEISSYEGGTIETPDGILTYTYSKTCLHQNMHYLLTIDGK